MKRIIFLLSLLLFAGFGCRTMNPSEVPVPTDQDSSGSERPAITVFSPSSGDTISSPLTVTGEARVFENVVNWRLEFDGEIVQTGYFMADAPDIGEYGPFSERIFLPAEIQGDFDLYVFDYSAKDGSIQDEVHVPLEFINDAHTTVDVYFIDPELQDFDCSIVDLEKRTVASTLNVAELALQELIKGPESHWAVTNIPEGTELKKISIVDGVAIAEFTSPNIARWNGGSCFVTGLRAQIEQTLLQFSTIHTVRIIVNGEEETILQP